MNKKEVESSDSNVVEAFTADWQPVGTEQTGPHTTNYDDGSQDRKEIKHAAAMATGLDENNMTTYWVGNAGDQKVTTTVFNGNQSEIYRVSLTWHDGQGWQVNKVEKLKEPAH
ncbi:YrrS family protein [Virgibacillus sp. 179-BFC.A HS]|uniref:YrrS family protein n=1 Tax=Tigheibacillus jepli TaxID=3035914 RepID=A0ABU5CGP4_9BACI|nr:YrrS family protein [Virgibacillus sp. 179-BFC.A HS]MDY0405502.1 YrrS family protein [Virgibacillus sp. 179-BFC.A HS]